MNFHNLEQKTDAWREWRRKGLTATDSPVILGLSPYKTPWRLWAEKVGKVQPPDLSKNPNVRYGIEHEDDARCLFEMRFNTCVMPACCEWSTDPLFRASFDGLTPEGEPVEIKCPSPSVLDDVKARGKGSDPVRLYAVQLQHQMLVADARRGWLVFYDGPADDIIVFELERDEALIDRIVREGRAFHKLVATRKEPSKDPKSDVFLPEGDEQKIWIAAAKDFLGLEEEIARHRREIERLQQMQEASKASLKKLMGDFCAAEFAGVSITKSTVKGRISAEKLFEAALSRKPTEAELDACRSPDAERWLFRATGRDVPRDFKDEDFVRETTELREEISASFYF